MDMRGVVAGVGKQKGVLKVIFFFFLNTWKKGGGGSRLWNEVGGASCGIWGSCVLKILCFLFSL